MQTPLHSKQSPAQMLQSVIAAIDCEYGDSWDAIVQLETGATYRGTFGFISADSDVAWINDGKGAVYFALSRIVSFRRDCSNDMPQGVAHYE